MVEILKGFGTEASIPAIEVYTKESTEYRYEVRNGFHRFYASLVVGFKYIPVVIKPYFNWNDFYNKNDKKSVLSVLIFLIFAIQ
ncbi:MAG: hypothetical protein V4596_02765 [Bdellovibrionota bacterium]